MPNIVVTSGNTLMHRSMSDTVTSVFSEIFGETNIDLSLNSVSPQGRPDVLVEIDRHAFGLPKGEASKFKWDSLRRRITSRLKKHGKVSVVGMVVDT